MGVVTGLLEQLGVATTDPHNYIEAFDANEDGLLSTTELVKGLLKLRGGVEKADVVANLMVTRDMQKSIRHLESMYVRDHHRQERGRAATTRYASCTETVAPPAWRSSLV